MNGRRDGAENDRIKTTDLNEDGREKNPKSTTVVAAAADVVFDVVFDVGTGKWCDVDGCFQALRGRGASWG